MGRCEAINRRQWKLGILHPRPTCVLTNILWLILMVSVYSAVTGLPIAGSEFPAVPRHLEEEETGYGHLAWIPLGLDGGARGDSLPEIFRSSEVVQIYHIQATAMLYEQGGLNHDMSFALTAVAFNSLERPEVKVSMAYYPTNMTISLLPVISEDGRELHWENQEASMGYVLDIDQAYWTGTSYMGETTGAFFSSAVEFSLAYHQDHPRYQPFSVYEDYPGRAFVTASSCDEYVWEVLSAAQERGVRLVPAVMPRKYKIVIYSQTEPEVITLGAQRDGDGDQVEEDTTPPGGDSTGGRGSSSTAVDNGNSTVDSSDRAVGNSGTASIVESSSSGAGTGGQGEADGDSTDSVDSASGVNATRTGAGEVGDGVRRRALLRGEGSLSSADDAAADATAVVPSARTAIYPANEWGAILDRRFEMERGTSEEDGPSEAADGGSESENAVASTGDERGAEAGDNDDDADLEPVEAGMGTAQTDDDWEQVVGYYQSLKLCLQERKYSYVTSLKDFARNFDCLDDVAFISKGPHEYYKVNLTSTKLDQITEPEDLPEVPRSEVGFTWVDISLVVWIVSILACGVHGMLWQGEVVQHWMKASTYKSDEEILVSEPGLPDSRPASLTRKITTEYLRLGNVLLGKSSGEFEASTAAGTSGDDEESQERGTRLSLPASTLAFAQVDRKERHRRVFSEGVGRTGQTLDAERRQLHHVAGGNGGVAEDRTQRNGIVTDKEGRGAGGEEKGIEMQAVLRIPDNARKTEIFVGSGGASGSLDGDERGRAPRGSVSLLPRSLSGDNESISSRGSLSPVGRDQRQNLSIVHTEWHAERHAERGSYVLQEEGVTMASPSLSPGRRKSLSAGKFGGAGPTEVVRSPKKYTLENRGGGGSSEEDEMSPAKLPRNSWEPGERMVESIGSWEDESGTLRKDEEENRGSENEAQARSLVDVDVDEEELWAADDSR